jgi:hypothetical protein
MPRIADRFLECSLFLYPTAEKAEKGETAGGSGFLAAVPSIGHRYHLYAVSNRHVVQKHPVIRLNTDRGGVRVIDVPFSDWTFAPDQDIAVTPVAYDPEFASLAISALNFLTRESASSHDVGIGDEAFMVGRFIGHDGKQRNSPAIRFGHVSMMPNEPVYHPSNDTRQQESFLVEMHSTSGYSGSPVLVRPVPVPTVAATLSVTNTSIFESGPSYSRRREIGGPWLLGVDWGYINTHDQSLNNTGMSGVVPAWRLLDLLNTQNLLDVRTQIDDSIRAEERKKILNLAANIEVIDLTEGRQSP